MGLVIEARNLLKKYNNAIAVNNLQFSIQEKECFGILGPNGAGKSSTMKMMYCASPVTSGELFILGFNANTSASKIKHRVGVVSQDDQLDLDFNVLENLIIYGNYFGMSKKLAKQRGQDLLRFMGLEENENSSIDTLSGGMKRKLSIARGLINDPEILFLDEPTTGLDPQARFAMWEYLRELKKTGVTLVLTTHYMEEAEQLCDRLVIMDKGKKIGEGRPSDLVAKIVGREIVEFHVNQVDLDYYLKKVSATFEYQVLKNRVRIFVKENQSSKEALDLISSSKIQVRPASLDDVFLKIAGHEILGQSGMNANLALERTTDLGAI